jgi:hypothetical protein
MRWWITLMIEEVVHRTVRRCIAMIMTRFSVFDSLVWDYLGPRRISEEHSIRELSISITIRLSW